MNRSFRSAALMTVGLAAACGDAPTEPVALRVAEHARVVLDVPVALPSLADAEVLGAEEFAGVLADLELWLDAADGRLAEESAPESDRAKLRAGRAALRTAAQHEERGDRAGAVRLLIEAEARLVEATARALTSLEIAAADRAAARCDASADGVMTQRGLRLLAHAREAAADGDYQRAVQRAHYAEALLAGTCVETPVEEGKR